MVDAAAAGRNRDAHARTKQLVEARQLPSCVGRRVVEPGTIEPLTYFREPWRRHFLLLKYMQRVLSRFVPGRLCSSAAHLRRIGTRPGIGRFS
jgi:hypothetical protein